MRTLKKEDIYSGNLVLINSRYPIQIEEPCELLSVDTRFPEVLILREAANLLGFNLDKIKSYGRIVPVSGYRSAAEQTKIFEDSLLFNGEEYTRKFVALPYHSEHQSGLAIDLAENKKNIDFICPDFPNEGICESFRLSAPEFGFILRYPEDKENLTGIAHEPWHFRYVGYPHSKIIYNNYLCFEEYIDFIRDYTIERPYLFYDSCNVCIEVFYIPYYENFKLDFMEDALYTISGNNIDGFIISARRR